MANSVLLPRARTRSLTALPPFPAVARQLLSLISIENVSLQQVTQVLRTDAAFSTEVLRLANSAMVNLRYEVSSILHAISVLGLDRLRAMILTVGLRDFMRSARHDELIRRCWRHNLACALISEALAEACWLDKPTCYSAGLLHDIGRLALATLYPTEYLEALELHRKTGASVIDCEREVIGADHREVGAKVALDWKLPPTFEHVTCFGLPETPPEPYTMAALTALSCQLAARCGFAVLVEPVRWDVPFIQANLPPDAWRKIEPTIEELRESIPYKINVFECEFF